MPYTRETLCFSEQNGAYLDTYRFRSLEHLVEAAARVKFS